MAEAETFSVVDSCPACGATSSTATGPVAPEFALSVGGEAFIQPQYVIRECSGCGLLFRTPIPTQAELDRYYARADFRKWELSGFYPTERCALGVLQELPKGSAILDFGCSSGRLLAPLTATYACYGVEVNASAADEAAKKGIKMLTNRESLDGSGPEFHATVLVDLFEHMTSPLDLLRKLSARLADNGLLIVVTGNGDARACRRDPALFWYFRNLEHVCMLTRKHAEFICTYLGLRLEQWIELSHYDLSLRERVVQILQNFVFWQFRRQTALGRFALRFLPGMHGLKAGKVAPTYACSKDHVIAVFRKATLRQGDGLAGRR